MKDYNAFYPLFANLAQTYTQASAISAPPRSDLTFQDLFQLIETTHIQLRQWGINRGDRVMLFAPANSAETATLSLAIAASATCIPIDPNLSEPEIRYCVEQLEPQIIIACADQFSRLAAIGQFQIPLIKALSTLDQPSGFYHLEGSDRQPQSLSIPDWAQPQDIAFIFMTSGSTAYPKFVPIVHAAICDSCSQAAKLLQISSSDICLNLLPLFHVHGLYTNFLLPITSGSRIFFYGDFNPEHVVDRIIGSRATWYSASPTIHLAILKAIAEHPLKIKNHNLRFIRSGSAPISPQIISKMENQLTVPLVQGYGMSEIPLFTSSPFPPIKEHRGFLNTCNSTEIAIVDELGELVSYGTVGEIVARGQNVITGYISNPEADAAAFRGGWFRTGDLGWLDEEGYLYLAGRLKEIINRGGNKVSPQEVDNALMQFSEVEEAGTFAVAHPRLGEDVVTAVVLKSGSNLTVETLRSRLFKCLVDFKIPSQIFLVDRLPKGRTSKIDRPKLAQTLTPLLNVEYANPRDDLEVAIATLFAQILNIDKVGIYDNFFILGGDSLLGTQLISQICQTFAINIPLNILFELPTVAALAPFLNSCIDVFQSRTNQHINLEYEEGEL